MKRAILPALGLLALGLGGCNQDRPLAANHGLCFDFHANRTTPVSTPASAAAATAPGANAMVQPAAATADPSVTTDDCVRRWAYSLAPSSDSARDVANAAVGACLGALARWNEQSLGQGTGPTQAPSITTGQPTNALAEHDNYAHNRALLYVVEARAGRCAPPPAKNGAPQGTVG
jgi:hypothetical protein